MSVPLYQWFYPNDIAMRLAFNNRMHALSVSMLGRNLLFKLEFALCYWCVSVRFLASVAPINDGIYVCASARGHCLAWVVLKSWMLLMSPPPPRNTAHGCWFAQRIRCAPCSACIFACAAHGFLFAQRTDLVLMQRMKFCRGNAYSVLCAAHGFLLARRMDLCLRSAQICY